MATTPEEVEAARKRARAAAAGGTPATAEDKPKKKRRTVVVDDARAELRALGLEFREAYRRAQDLAKRIEEEDNEAAAGLAGLDIDPRLAGLRRVEVDTDGKIKPRATDIDDTKALPRGDLPDEGIKKQYSDAEVLKYARENEGKTPPDIEWRDGQFDTLVSKLHAIKKPSLWHRPRNG